ncbi:MAG: 50S ribosomal protein L4 [Candidatus Bostrichicola ureolyticus]|nr:MAG: 50S ribosomal protein L4 [Candidatus Bostrichicola ureolyticus]
MEVKVFNIKGEQTDNLKLNNNIFNINPHYHSVYLEIKRYLASKRQGTHKTKERSELSGSRRKLHRQKGTGSSRKGDIKNPLFRGGARVFGPTPRKYNFKLNKSLKKLAKRSIISKKIQDNSILILEDFSLEVPKTKNFLDKLKYFDYLSINKKNILMVLETYNKNLYLASRNLPKFKLISINELNSYDLLKASYIILFKSSIEKLSNYLNK